MSPLSVPRPVIKLPITYGKVQPHFAMELDYTRFPNTTVTFDPNFI